MTYNAELHILHSSKREFLSTQLNGKTMSFKKVLALFSILLIISISVFISFNSIAEDKDCDNIAGETVPGEAGICKIQPLSFGPGIHDVIKCGEPVIITVIGGKPPFSWQISDNGYTLSMNSERQYSLSCASGNTCSIDPDEPNETGPTATITVTDSCDPPVTITKTIRLHEDNGAGWEAWEPVCGNGGLDAVYYGVPIGKYKYKVKKYISGGADYIQCDNPCASELINNQSDWGYPNPDDDNVVFGCEYYTGSYGGPADVIIVKNLDSGNTGHFRLIGVQRSEWGCQ